MRGLRFRVLGPVAVSSGGSPVPLAGRPSVNLLAGLLLSASQPVSYDRLGAIVWGDSPPAHPQAALQSLKSRICRALGADAIQAVPAGYQITVTADALDLLHFERLLGSAGAAGGADPARHALAAIDEALRLWSLPVLANVHSDLLLRDGVAFLTERYLTAQERRAVLRLRLGQCREVVAEVSGLVPAHPFREPLVGLLMIALYRSHRQAEALAAYQRLRRELRESLGVDPSGPLQRLHLDILRSDGSLDRPDAVSGLGVTGALPRAPRPGPAPAAPAAPRPRPRAARAGPVPRQLPPDIGDFTGRAAEAAAIRRAFTATPPARAVVLAGPGGIGKSALAVHAGHQLSAGYPDGQVYLDAQPAGRPPAGLIAGLLLALGVSGSQIPAARAERVALYRSVAAGRRFLLILDSVSGEAQIRDLLPPGPDCAVIICARPRLAGIPGARLIELDVLDDTAATELLGRIIRPARLRREPAAAAELVRHCGGLPLALRVAGARLAAKPHWRLATLARRLLDERRRLDELSYGDLDVRATISASYAGLPAAAQDMLRRLALLEAPEFPLRAGAALLDGRRADVEELCETLLDAQLLDARDSPLGPRYRLHDLVRAYARELAETQDSAPPGPRGAFACARGG